jgi:AcrR family transcriptional regulator
MSVDPDAEDLRAADGRVPGRRGRATRTRLLECTADMLATTSFRELKVIDIAREASTSPATFYQYFPDVESAILVLTEEMAESTNELAAIVRDAAWTGEEGYAAALELADAFLEFWDRHRSLLRVVDLATGEGDRRFGRVRSRMLNPVTVALSEAIKQAQPKRRDLDPMATAGVLVAMLGQVAAHRYGFEFWGIRTSDTRQSLAHVVFWSVTGQPPPGGGTLS